MMIVVDLTLMRMRQRIDILRILNVLDELMGYIANQVWIVRSVPTMIISSSHSDLRLNTIDLATAVQHQVVKVMISWLDFEVNDNNSLRAKLGEYDAKMHFYPMIHYYHCARRLLEYVIELIRINESMVQAD